MKSRVFLNSNRDLPLLHFLWKWKVAPTKALVDRFFDKTSIENGYRRILKLHEGGFIDSRYSRSNVKHVWQLSSKGFQTILPALPALAQEGFRSESVTHDLLVAAVHLGDWIKVKPANVDFYTEQELRCYSTDELPSYLPQEGDKRPDGYWAINTGDDTKFIALEVELNQKTASRYIETSGFYNCSAIQSVLWIVKNESLANKIYEVVRGNTPDRLGNYNFCLITDFLAKKWGASIIMGGQINLTIAEYLKHHGAQSVFQRVSNAFPTMETSPFLQLQKSIPKSPGSFALKLGDFFD